ncbi:MAG: type II secretion system protein [Candidatus Gastranaerophilales bacterium]|nr:type II secretion system protein [Candidatus Gastranaerophilales bacterium]
MSNKDKAFTLAEVLITLVIIGVIAALTIPAVINTTKDREFEVAAKKAAVEMTRIASDEYRFNDRLLYDRWVENGKNPQKFIQNYLSKYMNMNSTGVMKLPDGTEQEGFITADGMKWFISEDFDRDAMLIVDVNGDRGPNKIGRDIQSLMPAKLIQKIDKNHSNSGTNCYSTGDVGANPDWMQSWAVMSVSNVNCNTGENITSDPPSGVDTGSDNSSDYYSDSSADTESANPDYYSDSSSDYY